MSDADGKWDEELNGLFAAKDKRIERLEITLRGIVSAWREFGDMIVYNNVVNKDDYGFSERIESAAKLVE